MSTRATAPIHSVVLDEVSFFYGSNSVLESMSFSITQGDYVGIVGPNGGGKTTLLRILLGILRPSSGTVRVFGEDPMISKHRSLIGYVPQRLSADALSFPGTVFEVVRSGLTPGRGLFARMSAVDAVAVREAMEYSQIAHLSSRLLGTLSGGERQRVLIARALVAKPKLLILDEPTTGVDPASQEQFYDFVRKLNHEQGITILFVSHDLDVVAKEARTVLCVNRALVCHTPMSEFDEAAIWGHLYGKSARLIHHHHSVTE